VTAAADRAEKPLRASQTAGPFSQHTSPTLTAPLRCRGELETTFDAPPDLDRVVVLQIFGCGSGVLGCRRARSGRRASATS